VVGAVLFLAMGREYSLRCEVASVNVGDMDESTPTLCKCGAPATAGCDPCDAQVCEDHITHGQAYGMDTSACPDCRAEPWDIPCPECEGGCELCAGTGYVEPEQIEAKKAKPFYCCHCAVNAVANPGEMCTPCWHNSEHEVGNL
jgi:hypothetical protein